MKVCPEAPKANIGSPNPKGMGPIASLTCSTRNICKQNNPGRDEVAQRIELLHAAVIVQSKITIRSALVIGELLAGQKARLGHGKFEPWMAANLSFSDRTARRYLKLHRNRAAIEAALKSDTLTDLTDAYGLLHQLTKATDADGPDNTSALADAAPELEARAKRLNAGLVRAVDQILALPRELIVARDIEAQIQRLREFLHKTSDNKVM